MITDDLKKRGDGERQKARLEKRRLRIAALVERGWAAYVGDSNFAELERLADDRKVPELLLKAAANMIDAIDTLEKDPNRG